MYRYFIGISLPVDLNNDVAAMQNFLYDPRVMLHPLVPHITLLPPNVLTGLDPEKFGINVKRVAEKYLPIKVALSGIGYFDRRVVYIGVNTERLADLQSELIALLPEAAQNKIQYDSFTPHLTLAQSKYSKRLPEALVNRFTERAAKLLPASFDIENLDIFLWLKPRTYGVEVI